MFVAIILVLYIITTIIKLVMYPFPYLRIAKKEKTKNADIDITSVFLGCIIVSLIPMVGVFQCVTSIIKKESVWKQGWKQAYGYDYTEYIKPEKLCPIKSRFEILDIEEKIKKKKIFGQHK